MALARRPFTANVMCKRMIKIVAILIVLLPTQGCSFLVDLALFNNSENTIEVCNLNLETPSCQIIKAKELGKVSLVSDKASELWRYEIKVEEKSYTYEFKFGPYPAHASDVYCKGIIQKRCDIAVQFEKNGFVYWGGKSLELPVKEFPNQPEGFPVEPST